MGSAWETFGVEGKDQQCLGELLQKRGCWGDGAGVRAGASARTGQGMGGLHTEEKRLRLGLPKEVLGQPATKDGPTAGSQEARGQEGKMFRSCRGGEGFGRPFPPQPSSTPL